MVTHLPPMRGQVWACALSQPIGPHPVVIMTINRVAQPLASVTVVLITGTAGPERSHVAIGPDCGLKKYNEPYVNCTDIHTVRKSQLRRGLGLLAPTEMTAVEQRVRTVLGLD